MKILVLTKNHPTEITNIVERIYGTVIGNNTENIVCASPQVTSLILEESKGIPYLESYYTAINTFEKLKDELSDKRKHFIVVGRVPKNTRFWYDAIVGIDNKAIADYPIKSIPNNINNTELFKLDDSEVLFRDFAELRIFLKKATQEKENEL